MKFAVNFLALLKHVCHNTPGQPVSLSAPVGRGQGLCLQQERGSFSLSPIVAIWRDPLAWETISHHRPDLDLAESLLHA